MKTEDVTRTVESSKTGHYWLKKDGVGSASMDDYGDALHFQCEPVWRGKEDQHLTIDKEDLIAFLCAAGWIVEPREDVDG